MATLAEIRANSRTRSKTSTKNQRRQRIYPRNIEGTTATLRFLRQRSQQYSWVKTND